MAELKQQSSIELETMEVQFNQNLTEFIDEAKENEGSQSKLIRNMQSRFKRQSCIFPDSMQRDVDYNQLYHQLLSKEYVDLRNDIDSSAVIHILTKSEKNKLEQNFIKNAIQGLQLFDKHKDLLTAQGFGNHLLTQMKVEYHEMNSIVFHYGDYGQKYYIILKGRLDLLMPKSEYIEENNTRFEQGLPSLPYFEENRTIPEELPDETFEQYIERIYPKMGFIKTFLPGEAFGEIALMTNQQRTGSIIAREDSYSLVITKSAFHELLGKFHEFMQMQKLEFLQQFFFLKQIPKSKLLSIIQFMKIFTYQRNNIIYNEKQSISGIYFVRDGEIQISTKITQIDEDNQDESQKLKIRFRNIKKSEKVVIKATNTFFGEEEIILNQRQRNSKATCMSETCEVYLLTKDVLYTYGKQYNVVKKLKQNYDLKLKWEQQRTEKIQSVQKQNEENINSLNQNKIKEISLSKYMIQEQYNSQPKARLSFNYIPTQTIGSDEQIEAAQNQPENQTVQQSTKKHRKLSHNMEHNIFSSPQNPNKFENNNNSNNMSQPLNSQADRNNNFHLQNGYQGQSSSLKRQNSYLSPQPTQMKNQMQTMTPETSYTGRKSIQSNMFNRNSSINQEDAFETYNGFGDNLKDKPKFLKQSMTTQQLRKKNSSLDNQFGPTFNNNYSNNIFSSNNGSSIATANGNNINLNNINAYHLNPGNNKTNNSNNNSRETSAERIFFDSSHNEFESMLKKQTQMKQEILNQISKVKNPNLDALTDINKQRIDFKIRKQSTQYIPATPKTAKNSTISSASMIPSSTSKILQMRSQTNIPLEGNGFTDHLSNFQEKNINSNENSTRPQFGSSSNISQNNSERVIVVPASMANQKIQLNFFSTKVQGNDQVLLPSLSQQNIQQQQLVQQQQMQIHSQPSIQVVNNQPTLYQLDTLLEEDDENSPLKIGKKLKFQIPQQYLDNPALFYQSQNNHQLNEKDLELQKNTALLSKKFQLGKKVVKYIQNRKSFNEKLIIDLEKQTKIPSSHNTFNQFDDYISTKQQTQHSPINKNELYPQKEVILQVKVHKRGGSILQQPSVPQQQQQVEDKAGHRRRFTFDISNNIQRIQPKKESPQQTNS